MVNASEVFTLKCYQYLNLYLTYILTYLHVHTVRHVTPLCVISFICESDLFKSMHIYSVSKLTETDDLHLT